MYYIYFFCTCLTAVCEDGRINYDADWGGATNVTQLMTLKPGLLKHMIHVPKLDCSFSTFKKVLFVCYSMKKISGNLGAKKLMVEEDAVKLRNVCRHIRREWYKEPTREPVEWMADFKRPDSEITVEPADAEPAQPAQPAGPAEPAHGELPPPNKRTRLTRTASNASKPSGFMKIGARWLHQ